MDGVEAALAGAPGAGMRPGSVFYKMSGSGNDFILFDGSYVHPEEFTAPSIQALCDRRHGAGADGVILLDPEAPPGAHFTFHFWNSDGSPGPMCGNGALCATRLATLLELAPATGEVTFATPAGLHTGLVRDGRPEIRLPDCAAPKPLPKACVEPGERHPMFMTPSVPHLVMLVDDVATIDLERRGPPLRHDPAIGPGGANVNWVSPTGDGTFRMRTYERGVEGETLACGTGAVACAIVLAELGMTKPPVRIWTRSGLPLDINWKKTSGGFTSITLSGEGRLVFRGIIGEPQHQSL
jgi:diaminopimelate epimerase